MKTGSTTIREKIAREAATLLYFGLEKEFKQAKLKASQNFNSRVLPSNIEVALQLDAIAEDNEGPARTERLVEMRKQALKIMRLLKDCSPVLIGSVWRGTIRRGSDMDIAVYSDNPESILSILKEQGLAIIRTETVTVNKSGKTEESFHIHLKTSRNEAVEVTVRGTDKAGEKRKCQTFGDDLKGLNIEDLEKVIRENPSQKFIPT